MNASTSSLRVRELRCEYQRNPLGIDVKEPRLSWVLDSDQRGATQSAYQIQVRDRQGDWWDSGKMPSDQSLHIPYRGPELRARQRYTWRVRVWDSNDQPSDWIEPGWWEMGLLHSIDWQASWIEPDWDEDPTAFNPCPYLRTIFAVREQIIAARVYVTAHGLYELSLNGRRVGDAYFTPGYTSYHQRLQYQVYNVDELLQVGETVIDMGQNFSGIVQLKVSGPAGTTIRLCHGEALDKHGNFTMEHLALGSDLPPPTQEVYYTLKGDGEEVYTPSFTTHGFRYVKVEGFPGVPTRENFTGIALYSDLPETGAFHCSDPLLNQLQHNILWSQKSNFLEIPTDCPTRERAGWTGDAQLFVATDSFLMQTAGFFTKWLKDLAAEQEANGMVGNVVPSSELGKQPEKWNLILRLNGAAGWGDAAVIVPWTLYQCFGDQRILEEQYTSMKAWVEYERQRAHNKYAPQGYTAPRYLEREPFAHERYLWDTNFHWGEWLEPNDPVPGLLSRDWTAETHQLLSAPHIATAYFAYSVRLLAEAAHVLGKEEDAREYSALHQQIKAAYIAEFVEDDGRLRPDRQSSYVRALAFDLLPEQLRASAIERLVELIQEAGTHLGTGFLSTPYLCPVLGNNGHLNLAYALLTQDAPPSWLYAVKKGATTIWESWDGIDEEGNPHHSLNHYAYGAIGNWLYQAVAGIVPGVPGYRHTIFQPQPGGGLTFASATYQSLYGTIATSWQIDGERFQLTVTVPTNTTATVIIPTRLGRQITESGVALEFAVGVHGMKCEQKATFIEIGSGMYRFTAISTS